MGREHAMVLQSAGSSLKRRLRRVVDLAGASTGFMSLCERRMRSGLTILMYHRVLPRTHCLDYPLQALVIPVEAFEQQMAWLASHCEVLPVRDAVQQLQSGRSSARPKVAITFDDGYADNFEHAAPIMEAQGLRGTFFVTSGFVETGAPLWFDRAAALWDGMGEPGKAKLMARLQSGCASLEEGMGSEFGHFRIEDWMAALKEMATNERDRFLQEVTAQLASPPEVGLAVAMQPGHLAKLHQAGHEVAAHSVTHPILPTLSDDALLEELTVSRDQVADWIHDEVVGFCYPNGDYDDRVAAAAEAAGYRYACATTPGLNLRTANLLCLHRRSVTMQRTMHANGRPDALGFRGEVNGFRERWR